jgi:hypothetical protein
MKIRILIVLNLFLFQMSQGQTITLGLDSFSSGTTTLYTSPNGGYAFGTNGYEDRAKAQSYRHDRSFVLKQVLIQFGVASFGSGDSTSHITVNIYDNYGSGVTSLGQIDSIAPDSILGSVSIPVYQVLDDGTFTIADFSFDTIVIHNRFSVGVDFTGLAIWDTVGINSTTDGDAPDTFNAWELTSNNDWFTVEEEVFSWGLDVDFAIFPVIDENDPASVDQRSIERPYVFPNPCTDVLRMSGVDLNFSISVIDVLGKQQNIFYNAQSGVIDTSQLIAGVYFLSVLDQGQTRVIKFMKI